MDNFANRFMRNVLVFALLSLSISSFAGNNEMLLRFHNCTGSGVNVKWTGKNFEVGEPPLKNVTRSGSFSVGAHQKNKLVSVFVLYTWYRGHMTFDMTGGVNGVLVLEPSFPKGIKADVRRGAIELDDYHISMVNPLGPEMTIYLGDNCK